ncbi:regulatory protein GemA [Paenibacillus sp. oral taxon 786]|uniref:regulatory protein GemA n=1 Tax=Paenibacillus sp. oral taxon 786 TaxID=652715 RepID=UPI0002FAEB37|nr:regulatory protein GemA [Paenibacillus sp. oral taxon 786]
MKGITYPQIKKIYALARERQMDNETLHELVHAVTGSDSIKALSSQQAANVIDHLTGGKQPTRAATIRRPGMATPGQIHKIRALERELGWTDNPKRLQAFMDKYCGGIVRLEWLTFNQAGALIESLKGVLRSERRRHG